MFIGNYNSDLFKSNKDLYEQKVQSILKTKISAINKPQQ